MLEFTGERVVPGAVEPDLWNEHLARYLFASRLGRAKRVLDLGCGTGYGTAELARSAALTVGADCDPGAIEYAQQHFPSATYVAAGAGQLPFRDHSFDLIAAFEIIEHLAQPEAVLEEARRLLAPGGQLIVSTPNIASYAEARREVGPNPFHQHEFASQEFLDLLGRYFPHVLMFTQNHAPAVVFQPVAVAPAAPILRSDPAAADPDTASFLVAVCAMERQLGAPPFVFIPSAGNVLREREHHIAQLRGWLDDSIATHARLVAEHTAQTAQLEAANGWAEKLDGEFKEKSRHVEIQGAQIVDLERQLIEARGHFEEAERSIQTLQGHVQTLLKQAAEAHEVFLQLQESRDEVETQAKHLATNLDAKVDELARAVELLRAAEAEVDARTNWARSLEAELEQQRRVVLDASSSRWLRLGRALHLGPNLKP